MRYISWNCRGLGSPQKVESMRDLVRINKPEILLAQETKMEDESALHAGNTFWKKGSGKAVRSRGASGGLATFWDSSKFELLTIHSSMHWIYTKLTHKESGHQVSLFNLYVPILLAEKKDCWDSFEAFLSLHRPENIIIAGDLNVTLAANEKKGGSIFRDPSQEWVEDTILGWDLVDIKPSNGNFTWTNKRLGPGHIAARLDRFLVHSSFLTLGLHASSKILPNCVSDHKPILLDLSVDENLGPIPFRFSPLWVHQEGFYHLVSSSWSRKVTGNPSFIWEEKLRRLKHDLKNWAKLHSSPVSCRKDAQAALENHQVLMESVPITESISRTESNLQKAFYKACRVEEEYWR